MRILNLAGEYAGEQLVKIYDSADIMIEPDGGKYEIIFTSYALSSRPFSEARNIIKSFSEQLVQNGELHLTERSAEWVMEAILQRKVDPVLMGHIYGSETAPMYSLHSIMSMREMLKDAGFRVYASNPVEYPVARLSNGTEIYARNNMVAASKIWGEDKGLWKD